MYCPSPRAPLLFGLQMPGFGLKLDSGGRAVKTYSIRVPDGAMAGVTSEAMQACLRRFFIDGSTGGISDDPGAGPTVIRRTLPENLVTKFSAALGVPSSVALRRLAVSCTRALPSASSRSPARGLPSRRPTASNPESTPWWAPLASGGRESPAKAPSRRQESAISPWRAFWRKAWPDLVMLGVVVVVGLFTGGLTVGSDPAAAEPYSDWRPE